MSTGVDIHKNINQNIDIFRRMMNQYDQLYDHVSSDIKYFLDERMKKRASVLYRAFMFKYPSILSLEDLKKIDAEIKTMHPNIYSVTNEVNDLRFVPGIRYKYISDWRKNNLCLESLKYKCLKAWKIFIRRPLQVV